MHAVLFSFPSHVTQRGTSSIAKGKGMSGVAAPEHPLAGRRVNKSLNREQVIES